MYFSRSEDTIQIMQESGLHDTSELLERFTKHVITHTKQGDIVYRTYTQNEAILCAIISFSTDSQTFGYIFSNGQFTVSPIKHLILPTVNLYRVKS